VHFGDFSFQKQLLLLLGNSFLVTDINEFSNGAKDTWKWVNTTKIQIELIMVLSKMGSCAVPPDLLHSEISFSTTCKHSKTLLKQENKEKLFEINACFVRNLAMFNTYSNNSKIFN